MPAQILRVIELQENTESLRAQLRAELKECTEVQIQYRNKLEKFMADNGIWHIAELDYEWREQYEMFLAAEVKPIYHTTYLKGFDRIKRHSMKGQIRKMVRGREIPPPYENQILFLPYHANEAIARRFSNAAKKKDLVWDFKRAAPEQLKRQVYDILHYLIDHTPDGKQLRRHLLGLRRLYDFCCEESIEDMEKLETEQIQRYLSGQFSNEERDIRVRSVETCLKALFLAADEIHWDAHVWYMERIRLQPERVDESNPVKSLSFREVTNQRNRELLKQYVRYGLGITNLSVKSLQCEQIILKGFLEDLHQDEGEDICMVTPEQMDTYFKEELRRPVQAQTYNKKVMCIVHFFGYLKVKQHIQRIPFDKDLYLKKTVDHHNDRSVASETIGEILEKLYAFPEETRLMFLHLLGIGLRISEVCSLKGNAYYIQGQDAWIQVYQTKMRRYKRIPIPDSLYMLMKVYLKKYQIKADAYVFQNRKGGAYRSATFRKRMLKACEENNIQNGEYLFKSHDFRHTVATYFYDTGVPIQSIRDYLGHDYEEMTRQYIDYMPKKIEKAGEEYFSQHSLLASLNLKKKGGKNDGE